MKFDRYDVADALVTYAAHHKTSELASRVIKSKRVRDLANVPYPAYGSIWESLQSFEESTRKHYFALVEKIDGKEKADKLRENFERLNRKDGVEIRVENRDDDPFDVEFIIQDEIADAWADAHGSLCGGTWERVDGPDFVYDIGTWYPTLFDELRAQGYDLDFSNWSDPDEDDFKIANHLHTCEACEGKDFAAAKKHVEESDVPVE